ncbi:hypothetical protein BDK61_1422 [Haloarcula quadrata]|uniref:Uncharacterized protein n=1 Tax=Haloarcula quadrata TaxID=182779 RepID=A0A495R482_9EURY|nr:hypothetical protein [Haloarcula quadrata]RKS82125.1 hypothetical protein BDK61_1422 [Haloarcula quadrata]
MTTDDELEKTILGIMYDAVDDNAQIPTQLGSRSLVDVVTETLDGVDEDDILYFVERFDSSGLVDFSKHSDGHGPIKIQPSVVDEYDKNERTLLSDGRLEKVLLTLYEHDRETRGQPLSESELLDQADVDNDSMDASIWYLYGKGYVDATIDSHGWHGPSITEMGRSFYERRYQ